MRIHIKSINNMNRSLYLNNVLKHTVKYFSIVWALQCSLFPPEDLRTEVCQVTQGEVLRSIIFY